MMHNSLRISSFMESFVEILKNKIAKIKVLNLI